MVSVGRAEKGEEGWRVGSGMEVRVRCWVQGRKERERWWMMRVWKRGNLKVSISSGSITWQGEYKWIIPVLAGAGSYQKPPSLKNPPN